ncbi:dihydroorotase [Alteromonadaceae bacterium Bs31]|nr:dihydroorotase [Alteromonadaceae bacterium Bs31]
MTNSITITAPDDWHIHLRDGDALKTTVAHAAQSFARAIIMPNLVPPVTNAAQALAYKQRILAEVPGQARFDPLMVLYLTDKTTPAEITEAKAAGVVACKLYPAGATTNSDSGVTSIGNIYPVLQAMQEQGLLLLIHGEVTDAAIDIFDREAVFIERTLQKIVADFPELKVVLEHITTQQAAEFVSDGPANLAATITAHHLLFNRNHMLAGGIRPHYFCLPILKRDSHQAALNKAACSGSAKFFLGTDSAPHTKAKKEAACGCAGSYTAFTALELYATAFERNSALDKLEAFASFNGPDFYGLPRNTHTVRLEKTEWQVPDSFSYLGEDIVPMMAGEALQWKLQR